MALRNLEEQVLYLTQELEKIKQSLGNALPDPIAGPKGDPGDQGERGLQGEQGYGIIGNGTQLPSYASNGNYFILKTSNIDGIDLVLYKCVSDHWVAQYSLRGNQGPVGDGTDVVANPDTAYSESLYKITVDGVTYEVLSAIDRQKISKWIECFTYNSEEDIYYLNGYFTMDDTGNFTITGGSCLVIDSLSQFRRESDLEPICICENFNDKNGNARFVEANGNALSQTGFTSLYCKWSLSGTHLIAVLAGTIEPNTTITIGTVLAEFTLPDFIKNKIVAIQGNLLEYKEIQVVSTGYYTDIMNIYIDKNNNGIIMVSNEDYTSLYGGGFRIQMDLLIDME